MTRYVAFLRGINVGGHTAKNQTLQETFLSLGLREVAAFKQSGNLVFDSEQPPQTLAPKIEAVLKEALGFETPVFLRTIEEVKAILVLNPFKAVSSENASFLVTFLNAAPDPPMQVPTAIPKSTAQIVAVQGREVYSVTHGAGEGALPNPFVEAKLKVKATTRNVNVILALAEKFG